MHELHFIVIRKIKFWAVLKVLKIWLQVVKMAKMAFSVTIRFFYQGIIQTKAKVGIQFWVPNLGLSPKYDTVTS